MASENRRPLSLFPGSDPEGTTSLGDHIPLPAPIPAIRKGIHARGDYNKERSTSQVSRKPQLASLHLPKNASRQSLQHASTSSPAKRHPRDGASTYRSDSAYSGNKVTGSKYPRTEQQPKTLPRVAYHEFMVFDQAGSAIIACDNSRERNLVAIKRLVVGMDKGLMCAIQPFTSDHVVNVRESYVDQDDLVIIYEQMDISLRDVTSILQAPFKPFQIAAICKELVFGLLYIHEELSLYHGDLSCCTILLSRDGSVKIANIGESFAGKKHIAPGSRRDDICSLGSVMMELMEPTTYILSPHSTELQSPDNWEDSSGIKDFLSATQYQSLQQLRNHDFLPKDPSTKCLRAHVFCAVIAAGTRWDILSLP